MERLKGKVAIVTGSGAGIGKCIAEVFAKEGAKVVACSRRELNGQPVVDTIVQNGGDAIFVKGDISVEDDVINIVNTTIKKYGKVDILVNNAGVLFQKAFAETNTEDWDHVINTDLRGTFMCMIYAVREMLKTGGGSIINIASIHAFACLPESSAYDAAKWGMIGLSKSVAVELASKNVRVNILSPGLIDTPMWHDVQAAAKNPKEVTDYWMSNIPMGRTGKPEEIAHTAVFLASDESSYITGSHILVDGGITSQVASKPNFASDNLEAGYRK